MSKLKNIHLGEILKEEFLEALEITADTVLRLSKFFGTSAKFWLGLQDDFDLEEERNCKQSEFDSIKQIENSAA